MSEVRRCELPGCGTPLMPWARRFCSADCWHAFRRGERQTLNGLPASEKIARDAARALGVRSPSVGQILAVRRIVSRHLGAARA